MPSLFLSELFEALSNMVSIDQTDWKFVSNFATRWKTSIVDVLLDFHIVDESILAKALAQAHGLEYRPGASLQTDFSGVDVETFDDLLSVGAVPLSDESLAICNPYDDLRGNLAHWLCNREMVVTERSFLFEALRKRSILDWLQSDEVDA